MTSEHPFCPDCAERLFKGAGIQYPLVDGTGHFVLCTNCGATLIVADPARTGDYRARKALTGDLANLEYAHEGMVLGYLLARTSTKNPPRQN